MNDIRPKFALFSSDWLANYLKNYVFLAIVTASITIFTFLATSTLVNYIYAFSVGISTYILYNYHYLFRYSVSSIMQEIKSQRLIVLIGLSALCLILLTVSLDIVTLSAWIFALVVCWAYFTPFLTNGGSMRDNFWLKPLAIGLVFGITTAFVPYYISGYNLVESLWLSIGRVAFISSLSIIFDIGDVPEDHSKKNHTLPSKHGIKFAQRLAFALIGLSLVIEGYGTWVFLLDLSSFVALAFTYLLVMVLIFKANIHRPWWYYLGLVDGCIGLPWIVFYLVR